MAAYRARKKEEANAPTCPGVNGKSCFAGVVKLTKLKNGKGYRKLCDSCLKVQRAGYGKELAS